MNPRTSAPIRVPAEVRWRFLVAAISDAAWDVSRLDGEFAELDADVLENAAKEVRRRALRATARGKEGP